MPKLQLCGALFLLTCSLSTTAIAVHLGPQVFSAAAGRVSDVHTALSFSFGLPMTGSASGTGVRSESGLWFPPLAPVSSVEPSPEAARFLTTLRPCVPNPSHGPVLSFSVGGNGPTPVRLEVFTVAGRSVAVPVAATLFPGAYRVSWTELGAVAQAAPSGVYFARFTTPAYSKTVRFVLIR